MTDAVTIRRVRPEDWEELREIRVRSLDDSPDSFGSAASEARQRDDTDWQAWARMGSSSADTAVFVAVEQGTMVGLCGAFVRKHEPRVAQIMAMWVDPSHRGRGLADKLLDAASFWSAASGAGELVLDVTETNESALRLYRRAGFCETGVKLPLRSNAALLTVEMRKPITTLSLRCAAPPGGIEARKAVPHRA